MFFFGGVFLINLISSPLMKLLFTLEVWNEVKCVY